MYSYYSRTLKDKELKKTDAVRLGLWIVADNLTIAERVELAKEHNLDETILADANDYFEVPRVEKEDGIIYFFTRYPVKSPDGDMSTAPILVVLGPTFVFTNTLTRPEFIKKLQTTREIYTTQRTKLFLSILKEITVEYTKSFTSVRREVRKHFGHFNSITEKDIEGFVGLESTVNDYISALLPTQTALQQILSKDFVDFHEDDEDLMEDLAITHGQLLSSSKNLAKTIQNIRSAYSTIVAGRLNRVMKTLTALTIVLTVPMIITSFFGMNVSLPFGDDEYAFALIFIFVAVLSGAVGYFFAKNKWL